MQALTSLAIDIVSEIATLLHVVKGLGEFLTAEDDAVRTKGVFLLFYCCKLKLMGSELAVALLSTVLTRCPAKKINRQSGMHCETICFQYLIYFSTRPHSILLR